MRCVSCRRLVVSASVCADRKVLGCGQFSRAAVTNLARRCLSADGGQPFAADPGFLAEWYRSEAETYVGWDGPELICVSSLRRLPAGAIGERRAANAVTTGLVHPAWRRRGIGERPFDWAAREVGDGALRAETEALNEGLTRGLPNATTQADA